MLSRVRWIVVGVAVLVMLGVGAWLLARPEDGEPSRAALHGGAASDSPANAADEIGHLPEVGNGSAAITTLVPAADAGGDAAAAVAAAAPAPRPGAPVTLHGVVTDMAGKPLPGVTVWYEPNITTLKAWNIPRGPAGETEVLDLLPHVLTDAAGRFSISSSLVDPGVLDDPNRMQEMNRPDAELVYTRADLATRTQRCREFRTGDFDAGTVALEPGASISGRAIDEEGRPLAGVAAYVQWNKWQKTWATGEERLVSNTIWSFYRTTSAADGRFAITGLAQDGGSVMFRIATKLDLRVEQKVLGPGERRDLGDVVLLEGEHMAGRVFDERGVPVSDARVWVSARIHPAYLGDGDTLLGDLESLRRDKPPALTDPEGRYAVAALLEGRCVVFAEKPGFEPAQSRPIPTGTRTADVVLRPAASLAITVLDAQSGEPVPDATLQAWRLRVRLDPGERSALEVLSGEPSRAARPDGKAGTAAAAGAASAQGVFVVRPVGETGTVIEVSAPGHVVHSEILEGLPVGQSRALTLRLERDVPLTGRVVDAAGAPVGEARVQFVGAADGHSPPAEHGVKTDVAGQYVVHGLQSGRWMASARAQGFVPSPSLPVEVGPGLPAAVPDLVLGATGSIHGRVVDHTGAAVAGANVQVASGERRNRSRTFVAAGSDGTFDLPSLAPGPTHLEVWNIRAETDVDVIAGRSVDALLIERPLATIHGRVLSDGQPVAGATVNTGGGREGMWTSGGRPSAWNISAKTDETGSWKLALEGGDARIFAQTRDGAVSPTANVHIEWGADIVLDLALGGIPLDCLVLDSQSEKPLPGVSVGLRWNDGHSVVQQDTGENGRCHFAGLVPGDYTGEMSLGGMAGKPFTLSIGPEQKHAELTLTYAGGATLRGRLTAADGGLVPDGTLVVVINPADDSIYWQVASDHGAYEIPGLPAGTYTISVRPAEWSDYGADTDKALARIQLTLQPGETRTQDFTLDYGP